MKIVAGLGSIDEYRRFAAAGADEVFCGYVPYSWAKKYGTVLPLNRREVLCYNVQLGAFSELEILSELVKKYGKPVHLTFNSLYYTPEQYPEIGEIISRCMQLGFRSYIIADPALLVYLREKGVNCEIHLSGECGEVNSRMVAAFDKKIGLKRVIFHRKNTFEDMRAVAEKCEIPEREAFVLNEMCQFTGAFCNSLHCDEMGYLCRVPYELGTIKTVKTDGQGLEKPASAPDKMGSVSQLEPSDPAYDSMGYLCGETGCGLCALYQLKQAGITHLKLVGRGNYTDYMEKDIRNLRNSLRLLEESGDEAEFKSKLKSGIFSGGCSGNCYYR
ncbi:peptidase U32 family protein [Blautia sp.]